MMVIAKSNYLYSANNVYENLKTFEENFEMEAKVINYAKCELIRNDSLQDFEVDGIAVRVYDYNNRYELYYDCYKMSIEVNDRQIVYFEIE